MIDIHSHIVPGVDDGSESLNNTISMVINARNQGTTAIFATPHSDAFFENSKAVFEAYQNMQAVLQNIFKDMRFYFGCEIFCSREEMERVLPALSSGQIPAMNGTKYVLTEYSPWAELDTVDDCVSALLKAGWIPIIAHAERYVHLIGNLDFISKLRSKGCLIQLNIYSLETYQDEHIRDWARDLIMEEKVDFLGTDMHRSYFRPPSITQGMAWLDEHCKTQYLDAITWKHANEKLI